MLVDHAEHRRVDRDGKPAVRSRQNAALRIDDLTARGGKVDQAVGLALSREREMRPPHDLERPQAQGEQPEEAEGGKPDDPDAKEEAGAAVKVGGGDRNRSHAETPRNADSAPAAPRLRNEVAQRTRPGSASGTGRVPSPFIPLRMPASEMGCQAII